MYRTFTQRRTHTHLQTRARTHAHTRTHTHTHTGHEASIATGPFGARGHHPPRPGASRAHRGVGRSCAGFCMHEPVVKKSALRVRECSRSLKGTGPSVQSTLLDYCPLVKSDTENIGAATLERRPGLGRPAGTFRLDPPSRLPRALGLPEQNCMHACTHVRIRIHNVYTHAHMHTYPFARACIHIHA